MSFGTKLPRGHLPVYSVGDEEEADRLLIMTCPTNLRGEYIAPELAREQTLENLQAFSDRLHEAHDVLVKNGWCRCVENPEPRLATATSHNPELGDRYRCPNGCKTRFFEYPTSPATAEEYGYDGTLVVFATGEIDDIDTEGNYADEFVLESAQVALDDGETRPYCTACGSEADVVECSQ